MKKVIPVLCLLICFYNKIHSQIPPFEWANSMGGTSNDYGRSVATDASGNVYTVGYYSGTVDFDPSVGGIYNLICVGANDAFVQKVDNNGNFIWAKRIGGNGSNMAYDIAIDDANGFLYLTGNFFGTTDFDPDPSITNNIISTSATQDIYVLKLDLSGTFQWIKTMGGSSNDYGNSIAVDGSGNIYTMGYFYGDANFDPGVTNFILTNSGFVDTFIQKRDASGNLIWAKNISGLNDVAGQALAIDGSGNIYLTGYFYQTADFNPDPLVTNNLTATLTDAFVLCLNSSGIFNWVKQISGGGGEGGYGISVDQNGSVYTTGYFGGGANFDPGFSNFSIASSGDDAFILKQDFNGNFIWAKKLGGTSNDYGVGIQIDIAGNIYTTGYFQGTSDFDPNGTIYNLTATAGFDIYVQKMDAAGNFIGAGRTGGTLNDFGIAVDVDAFQNIYLTGNYSGTSDFNPDPALVYNLSSVSASADIFVLKLLQCSPSSNSMDTISCDSFTLNTQTYTSSGTYLQTLTNVAGCDSVITLNLTINNSTNSTLNETACDEFALNAQTYFTSGTYFQALTNVTGCDSIITLNLTINNSSISTMNETACDEFTLNSQTYFSSGIYFQTLTNVAGCDSIITLNLTINNSSNSTLNETACDEYALNSQTYFSSGTYFQNLTNVDGCDSVITLNLTINSVDVSVTENGNLLTANMSVANYQWVDCNNNFSPIVGATNQNYSITADGDYAVIVTENNCSDTSACFHFEGLSLDNDAQKQIILLYPNPTQGIFTIELDEIYLNTRMIITNVSGQIIYSESFENVKIISENFDVAPGIYFITIDSVDKKSTVKLVVE